MITPDDQVKAVEREIAERKNVIALPLRGDRELIVEYRDVWIFTFWKWTVVRSRNTSYLQRKEGGRTIHFHREVIAADAAFLVDHRNGNGLDNRRSNLRLATRSQNNHNRGAPSNSYSRYKGVSFHPFSGLWRSRLGDLCTYHGSEIEAAQAYDAKAAEAHGEFAWQNFPLPNRLDHELAVMEAVLVTVTAERDKGRLL